MARPSAVLILGYSARFFLRSCLAALSLGVPVLFRGETSDQACRGSAWKSLARDALLRRLYALCSALLFVGQPSRAHFERLGVGEDRLHFAPYAVSERDLTPSARALHRPRCRAELGPPPDGLVLLQLGELSSRKAPDVTLRAAAELASILTHHVHLLLLGDGTLAGRLREEARGLARVFLHTPGFKDQRELSPHFYASDLLLMPCRTGVTWGQVVNEALLHRVPCVVTDAVGCAPDLVLGGEADPVVRVDSPQAVARVIAALAPGLGSDELRARCLARVAPYRLSAAAAGIARADRAALHGRRT